MTLNEIIESVRDGNKPDYEDLRYAICAMSALMVFDRMALSKLAMAEIENKKPFLVHSAEWQFGEHLQRVNDAMDKPPKEYVGWNNDPENPDFLSRRKISIGVVRGIHKTAR